MRYGLVFTIHSVVTNEAVNFSRTSRDSQNSRISDAAANFNIFAARPRIWEYYFFLAIVRVVLLTFYRRLDRLGVD